MPPRKNRGHIVNGPDDLFTRIPNTAPSKARPNNRKKKPPVEPATPSVATSEEEAHPSTNSSSQHMPITPLQSSNTLPEAAELEATYPNQETETEPPARNDGQSITPKIDLAAQQPSNPPTEVATEETAAPVINTENPQSAEANLQEPIQPPVTASASTDTDHNYQVTSITPDHDGEAQEPLTPPTEDATNATAAPVTNTENPQYVEANLQERIQPPVTASASPDLLLKKPSAIDWKKLVIGSIALCVGVALVGLFAYFAPVILATLATLGVAGYAIGTALGLTTLGVFSFSGYMFAKCKTSIEEQKTLTQ